MSGIFRRKIYIRRPEGPHIYWDPITVPIVCMSTLYQRCSGNTTDVPILIASSTNSDYPDGYPTAASGNGPIQQFVYDINKAVLNGSPETWLNNSNILKLSKNGFKFYVNSVAEADGTAVGIMEAFEVNKEPTDLNYDMYIEPQETSDNRYRIGYSYFQPNTGSRAAQNIRGSVGISGAGQQAELYQFMPPFAYSRMYVPSTEPAGATDKYCNYILLIWPDKVASGVDSYATGGKWDFTKLDNAMGGTRKMVCELRIEMWQHSNEATDQPGTWFWNVYVVPHELTENQTNFLNTYLQGEDTGPKYNLGDETPDDGDEPPGIPETPPDLIEAGGYNAYKIAEANLPTIFNFLNSYNPTDVLVKMWAKPAEGVISLHLLPFDAHLKAGSRLLQFHGVPIVYPIDGGQTVSAPLVDQWQEWDMGTVRIPKGEDYLSYSPFTTVSIFLPFIGMRQLDADEVIGKSINVQYRIDAITGAVTVWVLVNNAVRYTFGGSCACSMPLSGTDWSGVYAALGSAVMGAVSGGLAAAAGSGGMAQAIGKGVGIGLMGAVGAADKPIYQRISSMGNTSALNSCKEPYIILEKQDSAKPDSFKTIMGNPASRSINMGSLSGFNVIQECHIEGASATASELNEIESLLKGGVIF